MEQPKKKGLQKRTKWQWFKTVLVGLTIPFVIIWYYITQLIEMHYYLLSDMTNWCDIFNDKIKNAVGKFIWGKDV